MTYTNVFSKTEIKCQLLLNRERIYYQSFYMTTQNPQPIWPGFLIVIRFDQKTEIGTPEAPTISGFLAKRWLYKAFKLE